MKPEEQVPTVSFEIDIGRATEFIDFDYDAYRDMVVAAGLNEQAIADHAIEFKHAGTGRPVLGTHLPRKNTSQIYLGAIRWDILYDNRFAEDAVCDQTTEYDTRMTNQLNRTVIHESGHHIDQHVGDAKRKRAYFMPLFIGCTLLDVATLKHPNYWLNKIYPTPQTLPLERFAYRFEHNNQGYAIVNYRSRKQNRANSFRISDQNLIDKSDNHEVVTG